MLRSVLEKIDLYLMRRSQFDSKRLRRHFEERYQIRVGLYSYGCFDRWRMPGPMEIGRYCSFASTVRSAPVNHPMSALTTHPVLYESKFGVVDDDLSWGPLVVGDDVWVGHHVMILPGCKSIGRGAIIGAGAIVTRDVEPYTIVAGNPAKVLRARFTPDIIAEIEASRWWELDPPQLRRLVAERRELVYQPDAGSLRAWRAERTQ
jgi:acetyltransferase-like isoleucine patch superfamily enzyme